MRDDRASRNNGAIADSHTVTNEGARAEPHIMANDDRPAFREVINPRETRSALSARGIEGGRSGAKIAGMLAEASKHRWAD